MQKCDLIGFHKDNFALAVVAIICILVEIGITIHFFRAENASISEFIFQSMTIVNLWLPSPISIGNILNKTNNVPLVTSAQVNNILEGKRSTDKLEILPELENSEKRVKTEN